MLLYMWMQLWPHKGIQHSQVMSQSCPEEALLFCQDSNMTMLLLKFPDRWLNSFSKASIIIPYFNTLSKTKSSHHSGDMSSSYIYWQHCHDGQYIDCNHCVHLPKVIAQHSIGTLYLERSSCSTSTESYVSGWSRGVIDEVMALLPVSHRRFVV